MPEFDSAEGLFFKAVNDYGDGQKNTQWVFRFQNGYGLSVICGFGAYATRQAPFEAAVLAFRDDDYEITYETPVADDILPRLTESRVLEVLAQLKAL